MFYCQSCAEKKKWPFLALLAINHGPCEVCRQRSPACMDIPSSNLPVDTGDELHQILGGALAKTNS